MVFHAVLFDLARDHVAVHVCIGCRCPWLCAVARVEIAPCSYGENDRYGNWRSRNRWYVYFRCQILGRGADGRLSVVFGWSVLVFFFFVFVVLFLFLFVFFFFFVFWF